MSDSCYREECDVDLYNTKQTYFVLKNKNTKKFFIPALITSNLPSTFKLFSFCSNKCRNQFLSTRLTHFKDDDFETFMDDIMEEYKDLYERLGDK